VIGPWPAILMEDEPVQIHKTAALAAALLALTACGKDSSTPAPVAPAPAEPPAAVAEPAAAPAMSAPAATPAATISNEQLRQVLAAQPTDVQARYGARNPYETLVFFGIEPGMTVVEALPGGGWYSKILLPYLGSDGKVIGADHPLEMLRLYGMFSEEQLEAKKTWPETWTATAEGWRSDGSASVGAFVFGDLPADMHGTADAVLLIRALHGPARFEGQGGFMTMIIEDSYNVLKPGGTLGVVQHAAREDMPDDWASGPAGYMKASAVIAAMEAAGFEFVGESAVNENPLDQPTTDDAVWRLPPSLRVADPDNAELIEQNRTIGESNRMTLKFRKP